MEEVAAELLLLAEELLAEELLAEELLAEELLAEELEAAASRLRFIKGSSSPKIPEGASAPAAGPNVGGAVRGLAAPIRSRFIDS